jgi:hypothetical protein
MTQLPMASSACADAAEARGHDPPRLVTGDTVIEAENDCNDSKITVQILRNGSQWQPTTVQNESVARGYPRRDEAGGDA